MQPALRLRLTTKDPATKMTCFWHELRDLHHCYAGEPLDGASRLAPHGPPTVELSGRKLAHGAPRGARAGFRKFSGGKFMHRARGAPTR